jgi:hypothetical protein
MGLVVEDVAIVVGRHVPPVFRRRTADTSALTGIQLVNFSI